MNLHAVCDAGSKSAIYTFCVEQEDRKGTFSYFYILNHIDWYFIKKQDCKFQTSKEKQNRWKNYANKRKQQEK